MAWKQACECNDPEPVFGKKVWFDRCGYILAPQTEIPWCPHCGTDWKHTPSKRKMYVCEAIDG